ncbi:MAG: hypothetical protein ACLUOI_28350 [Eisenbergiella sp.]
MALLCLTDKDMNPVTPVLPWCYTGASDLCRKVREDTDYVHRY